MIESFLKQPGPILDVRSPCEFKKGHIPGALNLPLFSDEERARVGTCYRQASPDEAYALGLTLATPKIGEFIAFAKKHAPEKSLRVHCWRGGKRSRAVADLLNTFGFRAHLLDGGYKKFRRWALDTLEEPAPLLILGGMTGTGKTEVLHALKKKGEQILDLEEFACHRGSSFGARGVPQPTNEQFENSLAFELYSLDKNRPIWVEDESRKIGSREIPRTFFNRMRRSPIFIIEKPKRERFDFLCHNYGGQPLEAHEAGVMKIQKRLGGARTKEVISSLRSGRLWEAAEIVLDYYDAAYRHSLSLRPEPQAVLKGEGLSADEWAERLIEERENYEKKRSLQN